METVDKSTEKVTNGNDTKEKKGIVEKIGDYINEWKAKKQAKQDELKTNNKKEQKVKQKVTGKISKENYYNPYNWTKKIFLISNIQVFVVLAATVFVWVVIYMIKDREMVVIDVEDNIQQKIFGYYKQNDLDRDALESFVIGRLVIMRSFDYNGQPNLYLLQGTVSPDIIQEVQNSFNQNRQQIEERGIVQVLAPPVVETIFLEELPGQNRNQLARRATVYVSGYMSITMLQGRGGQFTRVVPYRAQLIVIRTPHSKMNLEGFYIVQITEAAGEDKARRFDELLKRERERRGLR